jgi:hypothetical protein
VLLALTLLLITLMVTMTIGLGLRLRQKHELQALSDASAYSNAVMTARTYNDMSFVNRLEVSYWVSMAAEESIISWTSYARAMAGGANNATYALLRSPCYRRLRPAQQSDVRGFFSDVGTYNRSNYGAAVNAQWHAADNAAADEARTVQGDLSALRDDLDKLQTRFNTALTAQQLTRQILATARADDVSVLPASGDVSSREVDCAAPGPKAGLCNDGRWTENMLQAAMGTREAGFLNGRSQVPNLAMDSLNRFAAGRVTITTTKGGSGYWASGETHGKAPTTNQAWADDHGSLTVSIGPCSETATLDSFVRSTDRVDTSDEHQWTPSPIGDDTPAEKEVHHTMGKCLECPSVWVRTLGWNPGDDGLDDIDGQPKIMVGLQRDGSARKFPWELNFKFPFSATGDPGSFDGRGRSLHTRVGKGESIRYQTALSVGVAYYHRRDHWEEFPNLLNPFWRATLAPLDVDAQAQRDIPQTLTPNQADAYRRLVGAQFKGLH